MKGNLRWKIEGICLKKLKTTVRRELQNVRGENQKIVRD